MKKLLFILILGAAATSVKAQSQKIDLAAEPVTAPPVKKDNATLLKETQQGNAKDISNQYPADGALNAPPNTTSVVTPATQAGTVPKPPPLINNTTQEHKISEGIKTKTVIQYDETGTIKSSGGTVEFGK